MKVNKGAIVIIALLIVSLAFIFWPRSIPEKNLTNNAPVVSETITPPIEKTNPTPPSNTTYIDGDSSGNTNQPDTTTPSSSNSAATWEKVDVQNWSLNDPKYFYVGSISPSYPYVVSTYENVNGDMWKDFTWVSRIKELSNDQYQVECAAYSLEDQSGTLSVKRDKYTRIENRSSGDAGYTYAYDSFVSPKDLFHYAANVDATCMFTKPNTGDYSSEIVYTSGYSGFHFSIDVAGKTFELVSASDGTFRSQPVETAPAEAASPDTSPSDVTPTKTTTALVIEGPIKFRAKPSKQGEIMFELPTGTEVNVISCNVKWCAVTYGSSRGWMMGEFLDRQ